MLPQELHQLRYTLYKRVRLPVTLRYDGAPLRRIMDLISTSNSTLAPLSALTTDLPLNSTFGAVLLGTYFSLM